MDRTASSVAGVYLISAVPICSLLLLLIPSVRAELHQSVASMLVAWWIVYFVFSVSLIHYYLGVSSEFIKYKLQHQACTSMVMEAETMRYNLHNYVTSINNGDGFNLFVTGLWAIMATIVALISSSMQPDMYVTMAGYWIVTILVLLVNFTTLHVYTSKQWYSSKDIRAYDACKRVMLGFAAQLQKKTKDVQPVPVEYELLRNKIIQRILVVQELSSVEEAFTMFKDTMSPEDIFKCLALSEEADSKLILAPLKCYNVFVNYYDKLTDSKVNFLKSKQEGNISDERKKELRNSLASNKDLAQKYIGECEREDDKSVTSSRTLEFYLDKPTPTLTDADLKKSIKKLIELKSAVMQLKDVNNLNSDKHFKRKMDAIITFGIFVVMVCLFRVFHIVYNSVNTTILVLSILSIVVSIMYFSSLVPS